LSFFPPILGKGRLQRHESMDPIDLDLSSIPTALKYLASSIRKPSDFLTPVEKSGYYHGLLDLQST
ncbi:MAG TPA: hypothetical protein VF749_16830, partial [Candidatus Acidoferrum sp.]